MNQEEKYMKLALKEAGIAETIDEVPIGCIIVKDGKVIAKAHNKKEITKDPTGHAEIIAIKKACKKLMNWRLEGCEMYVTIEPCIMCSGAIIQSRISKVCYGAKDFKGGGLGSSLNVMAANGINHHPEVVGGVLERECSNIISSYFKKKRQ